VTITGTPQALTWSLERYRRVPPVDPVPEAPNTIGFCRVLAQEKLPSGT
jgi:hypothetical protein